MAFQRDFPRFYERRSWGWLQFHINEGLEILRYFIVLSLAIHNANNRNRTVLTRGGGGSYQDQ